MNISEYENNQETQVHGNTSFPFNIYLCSIPLDFSIVPTHWHNDLEIIYIKKGHGIIVIDFITYQVFTGDIIIVCPGQLHSISQKSNSKMEYENIIFKLDILITKQNDICNEKYFTPMKQNKIYLPNLISTTDKHYQPLCEHLNAIDKICEVKHLDNPLAIKGQLLLFFHHLFTSNDTILPKRNNNIPLDQLKIILKYIETNYSSKISIDDISTVVGFSKSHFMKFFKQNMGSSFMDYLNNYRLMMAARLLISSTDSVLLIACETGFYNISYFNRLFKKKYNCTPIEFREQKY